MVIEQIEHTKVCKEIEYDIHSLSLSPTCTVVMESGLPVCERYCRGPSYLNHHHYNDNNTPVVSPVQLSLARAPRPALAPGLEVTQLYPLILSRPVRKNSSCSRDYLVIDNH